MLVMAEGTAGSMMFMPSRFAFSLVSCSPWSPPGTCSPRSGKDFLWPPQNDAREGLAKKSRIQNKAVVGNMTLDNPRFPVQIKD